MGKLRSERREVGSGGVGSEHISEGWAVLQGSGAVRPS